MLAKPPTPERLVFDRSTDSIVKIPREIEQQSPFQIYDMALNNQMDPE
jgi:hypothetical protein